MESHLWYIETSDKVYYHWAGYRADKRSDVLMLSILCALAQALFVLTYEDIYGHDRFWGEDFTDWKKNHLVFMKKSAKVFDIKDIEELEVKEDKVVHVGDLK